jgi:orotidine-5'-phosphate decarboxylase
MVGAKAAASQEVWNAGADCVNLHPAAAEDFTISPFLTALSANRLNGRSIN